MKTNKTNHSLHFLLSLFPLLLLHVNILFFYGCAHGSREKAEGTFIDEEEKSPEQSRLEVALKYMEAEQFELALIELNKILQDQPQTQLQLVVLFNKASALENLERCSEAADTYRQTIRTAGSKNPQIEAQSLFRLSYCYECLGQSVKKIASLQDAFKRRKFLPPEISDAELPARLAAAYASANDLKSAEKYFAFAQKGLKEIHRESENALMRKKLLARTLYFMGRIQMTNISTGSKQSDAYIGSLKYLQNYLLKSSEMNIPPWSSLAAKNLQEAYSFIWEILSHPPQNFSDSSETDQEQKIHLQKKWKMNLAKNSIHSLQLLKAVRFPDPRENVEVRNIFAMVEQQEKKFEMFLIDLASDNELTSDAQKRQGLRRDGRVKSKPSVLESSPNAKKVKK